MTAFDNFLTVFILSGLVVIIYCKVTNKTLVDLFRELKEIFIESRQEV